VTIPTLVASSFLEDLALVLCVAAFTTLVFQTLRQPVVVGYLIAGMIVGPYTPGLLVDASRIQGVSELGVILLMFGLGLEFSIRRMLRLGPRAAFITTVQVGLMLWLGYICGRALGWNELESVFTGALLSISSTTIVAKAFAEQQVGAGLRELALGVLLCEDLAAVIILAVLTPLAAGASVNVGALEWTVLRLSIYLLATVGGGILLIPPLVRLVVRAGYDETLVVTSLAICFAFAMEAERAGYSVALGAFLAGSLVAESDEAERLAELIRPLRDTFAAVFFVSVGMMIDPRMIVTHWPALALLTGVLIVGKLGSVTLGAILAGTTAALAVQTGLSLTQIGEFSFIIAGVGISAGAADSFLYTVAVAVSAITTFTTPFMIRACEPVGTIIETRAPRTLVRLQQVYDGWIERVNVGRELPNGREGIAAPIFFLVVGAVCVAAAVVAINVAERPIEKLIVTHGVAPARAATASDLLGIAVAVVGMVAMLSGARLLAARLAGHRTLSANALPQDWERSLMVEILQLAIMISAGILLLAMLQPFLAIREGVAIVALMMSAIIVVLWRGARCLESAGRNPS
jgi:CPA2 family monovalent cation:H+ antiporter-2